MGAYINQVTIVTYYPVSASVSLEGLHPYQCFIYGIVLSLLTNEKTPLVIKKGEFSGLFKHSELTCVCALKTLQKKHLINLYFEGGNAYISNVEKKEGAA